jgi:hypothetical protein
MLPGEDFGAALGKESGRNLLLSEELSEVRYEVLLQDVTDRTLRVTRPMFSECNARKSTRRSTRCLVKIALSRLKIHSAISSD